MQHGKKMVGFIMFIVASANVWLLIFLQKKRGNALGMQSKQRECDFNSGP